MNDHGPDVLSRVAEAARAAGVDVRSEAAQFPGVMAAGAATLVERYDFRTSPCVDYGRLAERIPRLWLRPADRAGLAACLRALAEQRVPFKLRGQGHSSGGQALIADGAVIDTSALSRVLAGASEGDGEAETITVEGGCSWLTVTETLHPRGRRPRVLTDNPRTTVAGTLSVGGFGDSSHRDGLQAGQVSRLQVMTLDGVVHDVGPGDQLFDYTLCGRGQLGIIVAATLRTQRAGSGLLARIVKWNSLPRFLADAEQACRAGYFDYFRVRFQWSGTPPVWGVVGALGTSADAASATIPDGIHQVAMQRWEFPGFQPDDVSAPGATDLMNHLRADHFAELQHAAPALELLFPLSDAGAGITRLCERVRAAGLDAWLGHGSSMMVLPCDRRLPLAPFPPDERAVLFAMRPRMPEPIARAQLPAIQAIGAQALAEGAKLYLMSVELAEVPPADFLTRQFGADTQRTFGQLKQQWDPHRLLNPWVL